MNESKHGEEQDRSAEWDLLRQVHLVAADHRPASSAGGVHHLALLSSDVERTIDFYQGVLGNGNALAFFDFPGLNLDSYSEVLGSMHHLAISVTRDKQIHLRSKLEAAGVEITFEHANSIYFNGPDGERLELLADSLGEMNGKPVL